MGVNDDLLDAAIAHQVQLQRLSSGTVRRILSLLKQSETRLIARLAEDGASGLSRSRQERLLAHIKRIIASAHKDATGALVADLDGLAAYEGEFQQDLFRRVLPVQVQTIAPSTAQLVAAANARPFQGKLLREVYSELEASAFRKVRDTIRLGFIEGRTTDQIIRDLRGTRAQGYKDGILQRSRRETEAVVRTALNHTANVAREHIYEQNSAVIKGVRFVATLDGRTTLQCASLDGKVFEPGKGPRPPLHHNCRSCTTPVTKSWRELGFDIDELPPGTRASMDGQVPADLTYSDWLRKKPKAFQDEVLGPTRGKLFRKGDLDLARFTDRKGEALSLDQMRRKERDAWQAAFDA